MIYNLQLLRGLCALGVVFYHTHFQIVSGISTDFYGVAIFFAISGFIITEVTRADSSGFLLKRFIRVVPLYWLVTICFFLMASFGVFNILYTIPTWVSLAQAGMVHLKGFLATQADARFTADAAHHLIESFFFLPAGRPPVLGVGWTLNYEIFFYLVFGVGLAISRRWAPLFAIVVLLAFKGWALIGGCGSVCSFYSADATWFFVVGIAVHYAWGPVRSIGSKFPSQTKAAAAFIGLIWGAVAIFWSQPPLIVTMPIAALVLGAALAVEASGLICRNRFLLALGNASYSLYLTHLIVIETMRVVGSQVVWLDQSKSVPVMLASVAMSVALAFVVHYGIERPMLRGMRRLSALRKMQAVSAN
ncbi:MAG TPA: acyltransferase [Bosea sp. (in: a-proteobacteria)]|jgi:exopolysaccharide production protein ExoZ|uniref:acyltransferase family protein n=1 Tax=Bosea sp. (in: a-proteobacteria) TaxID=1871050 RepID=UPI002E139CFE|nr:acyltransferase [Bosea sp. (in: a-proteobacteria)]